MRVGRCWWDVGAESRRFQRAACWGLRPLELKSIDELAASAGHVVQSRINVGLLGTGNIFALDHVSTRFFQSRVHAVRLWPLPPHRLCLACRHVHIRDDVGYLYPSGGGRIHGAHAGLEQAHVFDASCSPCDSACWWVLSSCMREMGPWLRLFLLF